MCNAGIMAQPPSLTVDGYELQFGTNHLGHALLIKKLIPLLEATTHPRIVLLTSQGWGLHPHGGIVFDKLKTTQDIAFGGPWVRYGQSKLANLVYARELAKRFPAITSVSVHPGVVGTGLVTGLGIKEKMLVYATTWWMILQPHEGAFSQTWAATVDKAEIRNGGYYEPVGKLMDRKLDATARDEALAERLWDWTEEALVDCSGCWGLWATVSIQCYHEIICAVFEKQFPAAQIVRYSFAIREQTARMNRISWST